MSPVPESSVSARACGASREALAGVCCNRVEESEEGRGGVCTAERGRERIPLPNNDTQKVTKRDPKSEPKSQKCGPKTSPKESSKKNIKVKTYVNFKFWPITIFTLSYIVL